MMQESEHEREERIADEISEKYQVLIIDDILATSPRMVDIAANIYSMVLARLAKSLLEDILDKGGEPLAVRAYTNISVNMADALLAARREIEKQARH